MTFQPVLPLGGYAGWRFLQSSQEAQQARLAEAPEQARDRAYFRDRIGSVRSAEELVSDRRLLRVALGAFGLQDDLPNRAFIARVLEQGTDAETDLANRLANKGYRALAEAFDFTSDTAATPSVGSNIDRVLNDERHFRDTVPTLRSIDALLEDGRSLRIALAAFGLQDDLPDRGFLRALFEGGTASPDALANRLENPAYAALVDAFGFTPDGQSRTAEPGFASGVLNGLDRTGFARDLLAKETRYQSAVAALPRLAAMAQAGLQDRRAWVQVVTDPDLREVFTAAIGQTRGFDRLNLDQQIATLQEGARRLFGDGGIGQFADPDRITGLLDAYSRAVVFAPESTRALEAPGFADRILQRFDRQQFQIAVGARDSDLRLALNLSQELPAIAADAGSDTTAWLTILGTPPLRSVFQTAFGMPDSVATLDLDRQVAEFRAAAERVFGRSELRQFTDPAAVDDLIRRFTLQSQLAAGPSQTTRGAMAVILLQNLTGRS